MSNILWPPISPDDLAVKIQETRVAELAWLLDLLQEGLAALKSGLQDCVALLAPQEPGATLVLSSLRSENVKGFVTRVGTRIVKGDVQLRLSSLPPPRGLPSYPLKIQQPVSLPQLSLVLTLLNQALDIIDISRWTGDARNESFIASQLKLLHDTIEEARATLKGGEDIVGGKWWEDSQDHKNVEADGHREPALPLFSSHLTIASASLVLHIRSLAEAPLSPASSTISLTGLSLRSRLGLVARAPVHDELDRVFNFCGAQVIVKEKVRVETQDPSLMAVMAKLAAVGFGLQAWRERVRVVMGIEHDDEE